MRSRTIQVGFTALFIFLICQLGIAGQQLRYKFEKQKTYKYSTTIESKISGQSMGQDFTMTSGADFDYSISLISTDAGVMTLTVKYEKFNIKLNMPMMGFNDSTIVMKEYIGKRVKVVMTDRGKILSIQPIDTIPPSRVQMMASMSPADLFKQIIFELPEKEIDVNGSWKDETPDTISRGGMKMVMKHNINYKIVGTDKKNDFNCWKIATNGTTTVEGNGSQRGADATIDGIVKANGTIYIAPVEGMFILSEQSSETDMTTTATGSQTGASTISTNATVKTTLVK